MFMLTSLWNATQAARRSVAVAVLTLAACDTARSQFETVPDFEWESPAWNAPYAGQFPTGAPSDQAWSLTPYDFCFNGELGWEPSICSACNRSTDTSSEEGESCSSSGSCSSTRAAQAGLYENGQQYTQPSPSCITGPSGPPADEMISSGSIVNNLKFEYIHWGDDFAPGVVGGAYLRRFHRSRMSWMPGSLGPNVFLNFDMKLRLSDASIKTIDASSYIPSIALFDPELLEEVRFIRTATEKCTAVQRSIFRDLLLYDDQMVLVDASSTEAWNGAKFAVATKISGEEFLFEIVKANSGSSPNDLNGRLVKIVDAQGKAYDILYKTWTSQEISDSPSRQWQIDTVSDPLGRSLTFTYGSSQIGSRWCVTKIELPDLEEVTYVYAGNQLASVALPDGSATTIKHVSRSHSA